MTVAATHAVVPDAFSSDHLGKPVYRLVDVERAGEAVRALEGAGPFLLEVKIPTEAVETVARLTAIGFSAIDVNVQLDAPAASIRAAVADTRLNAVVCREAAPRDRADVERVAAVNLVTSRFHLDPRIDPDRASRLKAAWVGNFFEGKRGERLLVAERGGVVHGFLQVLERGDTGTIDLIALDQDIRGTGAFVGLIRLWLDRATALTRVIVGTQISNTRSLRSYERVAFRVAATSFVLHYHGLAR